MFWINKDGNTRSYGCALSPAMTTPSIQLSYLAIPYALDIPILKTPTCCEGDLPEGDPQNALGGPSSLKRMPWGGGDELSPIPVSYCLGFPVTPSQLPLQGLKAPALLHHTRPPTALPGASTSGVMGDRHTTNEDRRRGDDSRLEATHAARM